MSPYHALARKWVRDSRQGHRRKHFLYASYVAFLPLPQGWAWCD